MARPRQLKPMNWSESTVLITGGTGSLGRTLSKLLLREYKPKGLRLYSRDEWKHWQMSQEIESLGGNVSHLIGDVRDAGRLERAMEGVDLVFHTAAMKQVPACEYNPLEAIKTNVLGAENVLNAALNCGVPRVMNVTTDKAVNPVNLYGATKLCAEKVFVHGNSYSGPRQVAFSNCRYGNVMGSRGSVVPLFREQAKTGRLTITDARMTRFWITLDQVARFIIRSVEIMRGGEIFVPKMPSMAIVDLAKVIAPQASLDVIGVRPGEKIHECLITAEESRNLIECEEMFIILPSTTWADPGLYPLPDCVAVSSREGGFSYTSDTNERWLSVEELKMMLAELEAPDKVQYLRPVRRQSPSQRDSDSLRRSKHGPVSEEPGRVAGGRSQADRVVGE